MERKLLVIALVGLLFSQSPFVLIHPITLGLLGTLIFAGGLGGIYFDELKRFFSPATQ